MLPHGQHQPAKCVQGCSAGSTHLDEAALQRLLEHDNFETRRYSIVALPLRRQTHVCYRPATRADGVSRRRSMLELMKDPLFNARWNISIAEERRLALARYL